jgi:hypothetical protein
MTIPYYNADLLPGMIADLSFEFGLKDYMPEITPPIELNEELMWWWFEENLTGPFAIREEIHHSTYALHIQVSNTHDGSMIKMFMDDVKEHKNSFYEQMTYPRGKVPLDAYLQFVVKKLEDRIYYSQTKMPAKQIARWLTRTPVPITNVLSKIHEIRLMNKAYA